MTIHDSTDSRRSDTRHRARPGVDGATSRRDFLKLAGSAALLGAVGLGGSGCGRLLKWSGGREDGAQRTMSSGPDGPGGSDGNGGSDGTGGPDGVGDPPDRDAPDGPENPGSAPGGAPPDLAVIKGPDPARNLTAALAALGGMERFVRRGDRVVLKPNVLTGRAPEYAVTTNPLLVNALAVACYEAGAADVVVLDRPTGAARNAFEASGIARAASDADASVKYLSDRNFEKISIPEGRILTSWPLVTDVFEADVFINVPIAKDHSLAGLTMAMKNLMGVMGGQRGLVHVDFTQKIVDLATLIRPHLVVLDAHRILLRNGPTGGSLDDVRLAETLVVGTSQVAVDAYGATLFGLAPRDLGYLAAAEDRGLGTTDLTTLVVHESAAA